MYSIFITIYLIVSIYFYLFYFKYNLIYESLNENEFLMEQPCVMLLGFQINLFLFQFFFFQL